jgi:hypothetical protein
MDQESMVERWYCRRCGTTLETITRAVLAKVDASALGMPTITCYATGAYGECGHELADQCPGCRGGWWCPRCDWLCTTCRALKDEVARMLADGAKAMDEWTKAEQGRG